MKKNNMGNNSTDSTNKAKCIKEQKVTKTAETKFPRLKKGKKQRIGNIQTRLICSFLVPIGLIILLGSTAYTISSNAITDRFTTSTINLIESTGSYYDVITKNVRNKAVEISTDNEINSYYNGNYSEDTEVVLKQGVDYLTEDEVYSKISSKITTLVLMDEYIENVMIFTNYGYPISTISSFKEQVPYEAFMKTEEASLISKDTWVGEHSFVDSQLGMDTTKYSISYIKQFVNNSNKKSGFIILDVSVKAITDVLTAMDLPNDSQIAFITAEGREITRTGNSSANIFFGTDYYKQAVNQEEGTWNTDVKLHGEMNLFISSKIGNTGAMIAALVPYSSITSQANNIKYVTIIIIVFATVIAGLIGIVVAAGISSNIKMMIGVLKKAADGDFTIQVTTKRKDEFYVLTESVNHMIYNVKELIAKASNVSENVISSSENVTQNSELLLTASKDITVAINEIQEGIAQQAADAQLCLQQTDYLANQIHVVYDNSVAIEKIAVNTKKIVTDGITEIDQLNEATKANIEISNETIINIEELATESKAITEIIAVINEIAEQTNLLSLNASIEAARAGSAGRGFSVVADEIRKLAVKSVNSASDIEQIINSIGRKTQLAVDTVMKTSTISKKTEDRLANVIQLFNNINVIVDDLTDNLRNIAEGINDIDKAKNDTLNAIESISAVAEETSAASEEVDATAQQQLEAVTRLNEAAKVMNQDSSDLKTTINIFKIN